MTAVTPRASPPGPPAAGEGAPVEPIGAALDAYFASCRERVGPFVTRHFRWPGLGSLHAAALGLDLVRAPVNVLLALPALLVSVLALGLRRVGAAGPARRLRRVRLGFQTAVERALIERLRGELLGVAAAPGAGWASLLGQPPFASLPPDARERLRVALEEPVAAAALDALLAGYAATRRAAADLTAALALGVLGLVAFEQFTPGSVTAGSALAESWHRHAAIEDFALGPGLGAWFYAVFPPDTPWWTIVPAVVLVALVVALCAAFAGLVADPIQARVGLHRRRLRRWLGAVEHVVRGSVRGRFKALDAYVARLMDLVDVLRGLGTG